MFKDLGLQLAGESLFPKFGYNNQARVGHIAAVTPGFDITKARQFFAGQGNYAIALGDFFGDVFRLSFGWDIPYWPCRACIRFQPGEL